MENIIECPHCHRKIDVEKMLSHKIEEHYRKQYEEKETSLLHSVETQKKEIEAEIKLKLQGKLREEFDEELKLLKEEVVEKSKTISNLKRQEAELQKERRKLNEEKETMEYRLQQQLNAEREQIKASVFKQAHDQFHLKLSDKDSLIENLRKQIETLQRKAEQGSMQAQGEVQEVELEALLKNLFHFDHIDEVKKGVNGADINHHVRNKIGQTCGLISYESKRTKHFSGGWIEKLKDDMRIHGSDIGVIVTEAMPADMDQLGLIDGVWMCRFNEVQGLATILRDSLVRIHEIKSSQEQKGDKLHLLYDFLTSNEFKLQIQGIVEGFSNMKTALDSEKRAMKRIWKEREKQIDKVISNTVNLYSSIKGIAGNAVPEVKQLTLEGNLIPDESAQ